jgi:hypothetical protein
MDVAIRDKEAEAVVGALVHVTVPDAGNLAVPLCRSCDGRTCCGELRCAEGLWHSVFAHEPHVGAQVARTDEGDVETLEGADLVNRLERVLGFDLRSRRTRTMRSAAREARLRVMRQARADGRRVLARACTATMDSAFPCALT